MKLLFVAFVFLLTTASPLLAQSFDSYEKSSDPYENMTLAELESVNTKTLTREEKKLYKSALKAAKKAEKERIKAEEKRLRAETKRLKAEAKRVAKARKAAMKRVRYIEKIRNNTEIFKDDFEAHITIRGATKDFYHTSYETMSKLPDEVSYSIHSFYYPDDNSFQTRLFVFMKTTQILSEDQIAKVNRSPVRFAAREGIWRNYDRAALRGGETIDVAPLDRRGGIKYAVGEFFEDFAVSIDLQTISQSVAEGRDLDFKLYSRNAPAVVFTVPYDYLVGYGLRLADLGEDTNIDRDLFEVPYVALLEASGQ